MEFTCEFEIWRYYFFHLSTVVCSCFCEFSAAMQPVGEYISGEVEIETER